MEQFMKFRCLFLVFWTCCGVPREASSSSYNIIIDASEEISILSHFWKSTGVCPPLPHENASDYFLSDDMLHNLIHIGSVPHSGIKEVRMHWLLDMVTYNASTKMYNFTNLDFLIQTLHKYNLNPGFELMGSPSKHFTNFDDHNQVLEWMALVATLAKRYISMFGLEYVSKWNFETWNEPDHKDFDDVEMSVEGFMKYYDACSEGLKSAHGSLIFGGPGGSCRQGSFSKRCWGLLDHCVHGKNYITGGKGSRIDYISMHKKGGGSSSYILKAELETITKMHLLHPSLAKTPIFNDEGDPMVGWSKPFPWRADATYPAIVAKIIAQHQYGIIANPDVPIVYSLLSNDNGFLSYSPNYFTQRTLNARFQMNNTSPPHVHLVRKPIHSLMILLSKLGNKQLQTYMKFNQTSNDLVGVIAAKCSPESRACASQEISILTYASDDTSHKVDDFEIILNLHRIMDSTGDSSSGPVMVMQCVVDNKFTNPAKIWEGAGKPDFPSPALFEAMHDSSRPYCYHPVPVDDILGDATFDFKLSMPGVSLHHICWKPPSPPKAPHMNSVTNITSGQVLVSWSDSQIKTKCIKTYQVQLCYTVDCKSYKLISDQNLISNSFVYIAKSGGDREVVGLYRVAAVDFWSRSSLFSNGIFYGGNT